MAFAESWVTLGTCILLEPVCSGGFMMSINVLSEQFNCGCFTTKQQRDYDVTRIRRTCRVPSGADPVALLGKHLIGSVRTLCPVQH